MNDFNNNKDNEKRFGDLENRISILEANAKAAQDLAAQVPGDGSGLDANQVLTMIQKMQTDILQNMNENLDALKVQVENNTKNLKDNEKSTAEAHDKCDFNTNKIADHQSLLNGH